MTIRSGDISKIVASVNPVRLAICFGSLLLAGSALAEQPTTTKLGLNKTELAQQYLGTASRGDGSEAYRKVTLAMARKAQDDAQDIGASFFRVAITGTHPVTPGHSGDLDLWLRDPKLYWGHIDQMMLDLRRHHLKLVPVFVWNPSQIPNMAGETVGQFLRDADSRSWQFLERYIRDFIGRYREQDVILFYELTNELTNAADLDVEKSCNNGAKKLICGAAENYSTADVVAFTGRLAKLIKSLDGNRKISSGFAVPRPSAEHLRMQPATSAQGASWKEDSVSELENYLKVSHQHVDIISVHIYPDKKNQRFGAGDGEEYKLLEVINAAAGRIGKPLFVGEFGEFDTVKVRPGSFSDRMLSNIVQKEVAFAALWGWEFYPKNPYTLHRNQHSNTPQAVVALEPGVTDYLIQRFEQSTVQLGAHSVFMAQADRKPPRVVLTWPLECGKISGKFPLYAVASDSEGAIKQIDFLVNGKVMDTKTEPPYQVPWDVKNLEPGEYSLVARAYDFAGNMAEYATVVLVNTTKATSPPCRASQ